MIGNNTATSSGFTPYATPIVSAFYPINYIVESAPSFVVFDTGLLSEMAGAVEYNLGAKNQGKPVPWPKF